ncbi:MULTISPECIES: hypothetical protein [Pedobacter]|uniref:hypothetical protein n=1 Tax=Pedobacter TaxID=84567 RepID=UPI00049370B9|nr:MULTISPECIES: hypothetical protein [Pedobacter]
MSLYKKFKKATGVANVNPTNLFFTEHNVNGYCSKGEFCNYAEHLSELQFKHVEEMFKYINMRCKISNSPEPKMDFKTQEFNIWVHFELKNGKRRLPLPHDEGILAFLIDYQVQGINFEVDFELLLSEAGVNFSETRD